MAWRFYTAAGVEKNTPSEMFVGPSAPTGAERLWLDTDEADIPRAGIVSALPVSPVDGQEVYFQNAAMAAVNVIWRFRYRTAVAQWEFAGGAPWLPPLSGSLTKTTTADEVFPSGPTLTVPLAGSYIVTHGGNMQVNVAATVQGAFKLYKNNVIGGSVDAVAVGIGQFAMGRPIVDQPVTFAAGDVLTIRIGQSSTSSTSYGGGLLQLVPVAVT